MYIMAGVQPLFAVLSVLLITPNSQTVNYNWDCECGLKNYYAPTIHDGERTLSNEYPWLAIVEVVEVVDSEKRCIHCGGSIINNFYVLTAAHCFVENTEQVNVFLGIHDVAEIEDKNISEYRTQEYKIHPSYDGKHADIALIKLREEIRFSRTVRPICLPQNAKELRGYSLVAGWDRTGHWEVSGKLKRIPLRQMPRKQCSEVLSYHSRPNNLLRNVICANHTTNFTCKVGSGGPMMTYMKGYQHHLIQTGLFSFGDPCPTITNISNDRNINMATVKVFTKVSSYLDWIHSNTNDTRYCVRPGSG